VFVLFCTVEMIERMRGGFESEAHCRWGPSGRMKGSRRTKELGKTDFKVYILREFD